MNEIRAIINDAILAKLAIKRGEIARAESLIDYIINADETELADVIRLQNIFLKSASLKKIGNITKDIRKLAEKAKINLKNAKVRGSVKPLKYSVKLLEYIISLGNIELIEEERWKKLIKLSEVELTITVALELALRQYIKYKTDPYFRWVGHEIDSVFEVVDGARKEASKFWEKTKQGSKSAFSAVKKPFLWLFGKEDAKGSISNEIRKKEQKLQSLQKQPDVPVKYDKFENLFSDGFNIFLWGILAYVVVAKNIPRWLAQRKQVKVKNELVEEIYERVDTAFGASFLAFTEEFQKIAKRVEVIEGNIIAQSRLLQGINRHFTGAESDDEINVMISRVQGIERIILEADSSLNHEILREWKRIKQEISRMEGRLKEVIESEKERLYEKINV